MKLFLFAVLLLGAALRKVDCDIDSSGTDFLVLFPWNNGDAGSKQDMSLDFVNQDSTWPAAVQLTYYVIENNTPAKKSQNFTVPALNSTRIAFDSGSCYQKIVEGMNKYPSTKIRIHASTPISVFAHNYYGFVGDSFTVLPIVMYRQEYAFSLPAASQNPQGMAMLYLLTDTNGTNVNLTVTTNILPKYETTVILSDLAANVSVYAILNKSATIYASGDKPFGIIAAVRQLPVVTFPTLMDFGCFMPLPLISKDCGSGADDHVTDLTAGAYYLFTPPSQTCTAFDVNVYDSDGGISTVAIVPGGVQPIQEFNRTLFGDVLAFHSNSTPFQVVRYGGCGIFYDYKSEGAFLDNLPSVSQFITGATAFVMYRTNDEITIIGDNVTKNAATLDGKKIHPGFFHLIKYGTSQSYFATSTLDQGFHLFSAPGQYVLHVSGSTNNTAQGFTPRINLPVQGPSTTPTTPITNSATPANSTSPTNTTPSAPSSKSTVVTTPPTTVNTTTPTTQGTIPSQTPTASSSPASNATSLIIFLALYLCLNCLHY